MFIPTATHAHKGTIRIRIPPNVIIAQTKYPRNILYVYSVFNNNEVNPLRRDNLKWVNIAETLKIVILIKNEPGIYM